MPIRHRFALPALLALSVVTPSIAQYTSPVRLYGTIVRQRPWPATSTWFTDDEMRLLASRYEIVEGLDGHGYDWPGAVGPLLDKNPNATALCHWHAMTVQPTGDAFGRLNFEEEAFIHSADPASLVVAAHQGSTKVCFKRDARAGMIAPEDPEAPTVREYIIERATNSTSAFSPIGVVPEIGDSDYMFSVAGVNGVRVYRVRTKLSDGTIVPYSWNATTDTLATARVVSSSISRSAGLTRAVVAGNPPTDPARIVFEADLNNDKVFTDDERFACASTQARSDGTRVYTGSITGEGSDDFYSYRVLIDGVASSPPDGAGAHQSGALNNRVQVRGFGSLCVWPTNPTWVALTHERLGDALAMGYSGMRLDYTLDTLDAFWSATGLTPDWAPDDQRIADGVDALLAGMKGAFPQAIISINGRYTLSDAENYPRFMESCDIAEFEYFAVGYQPDHPYLHSSTFDMMENVWMTRYMNKRAALVSGASTTNLAGRLRVLTMYLLVCDPGVMLYNHTENYLEDVVHLPEWDLPIGEPRTLSRWWYDIDDERGDLLMSRAFENGEVFYNPHQGAPATINLQQPMHRLDIEGGLSELVGGDGRLVFTPVSGTITIPPGEPLILLGDVDTCPGDTTGDRRVNIDDLSAILSVWGDEVSAGSMGDPSKDGVVSVDDLSAVLATWGSQCP